jgi:hypothetical protein
MSDPTRSFFIFIFFIDPTNSGLSFFFFLLADLIIKVRSVTSSSISYPEYAGLVSLCARFDFSTFLSSEDDVLFAGSKGVKWTVKNRSSFPIRPFA